MYSSNREALAAVRSPRKKVVLSVDKVSSGNDRGNKHDWRSVTLRQQLRAPLRALSGTSKIADVSLGLVGELKTEVLFDVRR
jgi:hypothetical protein